MVHCVSFSVKVPIENVYLYGMLKVVPFILIPKPEPIEGSWPDFGHDLIHYDFYSMW